MCEKEKEKERGRVGRVLKKNERVRMKHFHSLFSFSQSNSFHSILF